MAINGYVFTMATPNTETTSELLGQLAGLLVVGSRADGRVYLSDLCQSLSINPWAKYKPFRYQAWNFASDTARDNARVSANHGFDLTNAKVSNTNDVTGIGAKYTDGRYNGWTYLRPQGGASSPNRLRDFDGYNHLASPFLGGMTIAKRHAKEDGDLTISFIITDSSSGRELTHNDIPAIANSYIGAAFVADDGTTYRMTSESMIAVGGITLECDMDMLPNGEYTVYPFLSSVIMKFFDGNVGNLPANVYTLPNVSGRTFTLASDSIEIELTCYYQVARLYYTIKITNNSSGARTLTNNNMMVRLGNKTSWNDILEDEEMYLEGLPDDPITIESGKTYTKTSNIGVSNATLRDNTKLWVSLHGGNYIASKAPDQTITGN